MPPFADLDPGVTMARHHALDWLTRDMGQAWDDVSTDPGHRAMKSGKQRRAEIKAARAKREAARPVLRGGRTWKEIPTGTAPCNPARLAPSNSYSVPEFVERGCYFDVLFRCAGCGIEDVWTATPQKWWYEVAKGSVESTAKLCNPCRRAERERRAEARRVQVEGMAAKAARRAAPASAFKRTRPRNDAGDPAS